MPDVPRLYRTILQVADLGRAARFYAKLLGVKGRRVHASRHYFDCGPVILALVNPTGEGRKAKPSSDYLYFAVKDLEKVHARARKLKCLSKREVHGDGAGDIVKRPWGERSFYASDPFRNGLCFVDARTKFTGR